MTNKYTQEEKRLARFTKVMGHPARIAILKFLASRGEVFFGEIHEMLSISKATVSQHLSKLKDAGLIQGESLPPKVKYYIHPENWQLAKEQLYDFMNLYTAPADSCEG